MLAAFSALVLLLSAVLAATTMTAFLAQQVRQIAVMKAIGARSSQIGTLYALPVLLIGVLAVACGLPLGVSAGRGFANAVAQLLNLRLLAVGPPWSVLLAAAVPGILAPLLAAAWPIVQATRSSVRSALADSAIARDSARAGTFARRLGRLGVGDIALTLALRNSLRRRGRLLLNVILLGVAGALFINCLGMRWAWQDDIAQAALARHYDIEVQLLRPASIQHLQDALAPIAGITAIESWDTVGVGIDSGQAFTVVRSYPDGGHGVLNLRATPPGSRFIDHPLLAGRWLREDDVDAVVLNTGASRGLLGGARVGDRIALRVDDRPVSVQVVGIVQQTMSPAAIHISPAGFAQAVARPGRTAVLRIALADRSGVESAGAAVVERLERAGSAVKLLMTERRFAAAQGGHILVLVYALATIAILMAAVGLLGLASALGTSVVERIREFGVMRALGARSAQIRRSLLAEGVIVCLLSVLLSIVLVLPLASIVGRLLARISAQPLAWLPGPSAVLAWTCLVLPCALLASWWPAQRASTWQIRETLGVS
jgi:putative ABC transport system permease protein